MIPIVKTNIPIEVSPNGPRGFYMIFPAFHRLRKLNLKAVNMLSTILVLLFDDFYPALKH